MLTQLPSCSFSISFLFGSRRVTYVLYAHPTPLQNMLATVVLPIKEFITSLGYKIGKFNVHSTYLSVSVHQTLKFIVK